MAQLFAAMRENHPPSTVHLSAAGYFRAADEENLVVARSTNLEVYAMRFPGGSDDTRACVDGTGSAAPGNAHGTPLDKPARKAVLQCVGRYDLSGHVEAMALMKPPGKERDCLLLVFRDAKMSVVEYSPATDEITTVALFMFEESELKRGRVSWHMPPVLRIDPRRRCIGLLVYESKLIIIPIRYSAEGDIDDDLAPDEILQPNKKFKGEKAAQGITRLGGAPSDHTLLGFLPSYVIDLDEAADLHGAKGIRGVADFTFLEGYDEPTICFLHENKRTWVGRLAVSHHTKMITTIILTKSGNQKRHPCIWGSSRIPHDCKHLVPLPAPVGGVVIVSSTAVMYRNYQQRCALKFSDYAVAAGDGGHRFEMAEEVLLFDTVLPVRLDGYQLMFSLKNGNFYVLNVKLDKDDNTVKGLEVEKVRSVVDTSVGCATTMTRLGADHLFVGARIGDSALIRIHKVPKSSMPDKNALMAQDLLSYVLGGHAGAGTGARVKAEGDVNGDSVMGETDATGGAAKRPAGIVELNQEASAQRAAPSAGQVKAKKEGDSSDDELYGEPVETSPAATTMDVSGEDSDEELYATSKTMPAAAVGGAGDVAEVGMRGGDEEDMDDEDAAIYDVARAEDVADRLVVKSELMFYVLQQEDRLLGLGPVGDFSLCPHRPNLDEVRNDTVDIVTASGGFAQAKMCVTHRSLNPIVTTAVSLPKAHAVWTVYGHEEEDLEMPAQPDKDGVAVERMHAFMIISLGGDDKRTVVFVIKGEDLEELEPDESMVQETFHTNGSTVFVGNLFHNRRIVQVTPDNVLVLKGAVKDQEVPFVGEAGKQIVAAWVHDPYVALLLQDGRLSILVGDESTMQVNFMNLGDSADSEIKNVTAACFLRNPLLRCKPSEGSGGAAGAAAGGAAEADDQEAEDAIEVLLAVADRAGHMDLYALPSLQRVYRATDLVLGPHLLMDERVAPRETQLHEVGEPPFIMDICIRPLPDMGERAQDPAALCLVAITSHADLLIYKSFCYDAGAGDSNDVMEAGVGAAERGAAAAAAASGSKVMAETLRAMQTVRFSKQVHDMMLRGLELKKWQDFFGDEPELGDPTREASLTVLRTARLIPLENVNGERGILVAGRHPAVVVFGRGFVRVHPWKLELNEGVRSAARFCSGAASNDIVCIGDKGEGRNMRGMLKICSLPRDLVLDAYWPVRIKQLSCTVHHVCYHPPSGCHVIISSVIDEMDEERKPEGTFEGKVPMLVEERYQLQLLAPYTLDVIDTHVFDYVNGEQALCLQLVHMKNTRNPDFLLPLIAVGTGFVNGESEASRSTGRVYVFELSEVVGEEGLQGRVSFKIKQIFSSADLQDIKAPVTALCQLEGYLLVAQGPNPGMIGGSKLYVYEWVEEKLVGRAFFDAHLYITTLKTIKFFIIFGDVHHSVHLLRWREDIRMLQLLARDPMQLSVYATEFIVMGNQLGIIASDEQRNIQIFIFNPNSPYYRRQQLICQADLHVGTHINKFIRWRMPLRPQLGVRLAAHFVTLDGAFGCVCPLSQKAYQRLLALQTKLETAVPHVAGLNPRTWRLFRPALSMKRRYSKNFLDGNLLGRYIHLDLGLQLQLASALHQSRDVLLGDLYELLVSTQIT